MKTTTLNLEHFNYTLPQELIASKPTEERDTSRLLKFAQSTISDHNFLDLPNLLPQNTSLIFNNTKVIPARLFFRKPTGALIEILMLESVENHGSMELSLAAKGKATWKCMIGNARKWKPDMVLCISDENFKISASRDIQHADWVHLEWEDEYTLAELLNLAGKLALPPYMNREMVDHDKVRYQTVYASIPGAIAAPTAGLHFSEPVLNALNQKGIQSHFITLHVGAGTFQPVETEDITAHSMHREFFEVSVKTIESMAYSDFIVSVGTTSLRTLESLYWLASELHDSGKLSDSVGQFSWKKLPGKLSYHQAMETLLEYAHQNKLTSIEAFTQIMMLPGYQIRSSGALITNFHLPKSTLLMLVEAAIGPSWKKVYAHAIREKYRFLSYGDSSLLFID